MNVLMRNLLELQSLEFDETIRPSTEKRIAELRAEVPEPILGHYDRLGDRGKKGIALVRNQVCTGCHMRVPIAVVIELMHGDDVRLCDNCGRYLYLDESVPNTPPAPTAAPVVPQKKTPAAKKSRAALAHAV